MNYQLQNNLHTFNTYKKYRDYDVFLIFMNLCMDNLLVSLSGTTFS